MRFRRSCEVDEFARDGGWMTGWRYRRAVMTLRAGGIVAYPTESVYGIGCDPWDRSAVARVFAVKRRPTRKRCIVIAADPSQLHRLVDVQALRFSDFASRYWPGPVTLVAPARNGVPAWLVDADGTIATRVTGHPVAGALCEWVSRTLDFHQRKPCCPPACPRCVAGPGRVRHRDRLLRRRTGRGVGGSYANCRHPRRPDNSNLSRQWIRSCIVYVRGCENFRIEFSMHF